MGETRSSVGIVPPLGHVEFRVRGKRGKNVAKQNQDPGDSASSEANGGDRINYVSISHETRTRYLNYALSVITSRALPDVRDGLKPVQRRILWVMYGDLGLTADGTYVKCARIAGDTIGKYHPHSPEAVYDALVRLAQDFTMRSPLIDGEGNFGSLAVPRAANMRYTEARLRPLAEQLMSELRLDTVDFRPNYDGKEREPLVLPARFPHLLVNGAQGIAVGMATSIPPHNLKETIDACIHLIHDREATTAQLMKFIKGPDFPLGGRIISERRDLRQVYEEGRGSIKVRAEWRLDKEKRKEVPDRLVVYSLPYGVDTGPLLNEIGEIIGSRKLPQLLDASDQTDADHGLRLVLGLKPGADPAAVMAYLYKHTQLEQNFAYNSTCLVPDEHGALVPRRLNLNEMLRYYLDFRFDTVKRRFEHVLAQLQRRIHLLLGFKIVFDGLDRALKIIRQSDGKSDAAAKLMKAFPLDADQTNAILELQLYRISQLEIDDILKELREKKQSAAEITALLASNRRLWKTVETELAELAEKFGDARRTSIGTTDEIAEFDPEAYIVRENTNVVVTREGWIKRVGRLASVEQTRIRDGDEVLTVVPASTLDHVVYFSSDGVAYTQRVDQVPASSGYGEPLTKHFRLGDGASIVAALSTDARFTPEDKKVKGQDSPAPYLMVATARGQVLRIPLHPFRQASTKVGRKYCRLGQADRVVFVELVRDATTMFLATAAARILHFAVSEVPVLSGPGKGVRGIRVAPDDQVLGGALLTHPRDCLYVETTAEKEMVFGQVKYEVTSRGGKGVRTSHRSGFARVRRPPIELVDWSRFEAASSGGKQ
jgi:DNA gyrase subunit A